MILVTLGTQDKSFKRLLDAVQKQIEKGNITEQVIVQAGSTKYPKGNMEIFDLVSMDKMDELMNQCDLLITHGGVGSIISGLNKGKVVIGAARLKEYCEHTNNHQLEIIDNFSRDGYILKLDDFDNLDKVLKKSKKFKPKKYKSNQANMVNLVKESIDNLIKNK